jgi:hypothetical protein
MKRQRTIVSILTLLAGLCGGMPVAALASAPLLGGYGGPGAGAQTILGATLVNGATGSSGGGSAGGGATATTATGVQSDSAGTTHSATGTTERAGVRAHSAGPESTTRAAHGTYPRAVGANPNSSHLGSAAAVSTSATGSSWFSGADLLALLLATGALALVAAATVRLTRTEHH